MESHIFLLFLLIVGVVLFVFGIQLIRVGSKINKMKSQETSSSDLNHINNAGIFTEHGMVRSEGSAVRAQSKYSNTFIKLAK